MLKDNINTNVSLSVIVPVYNAEKYIEKCLDSIINQLFLDFEVIVIDDGSSDASLDICNYYADKDKRIRVFHQENQGLVAARKKGIEYAIGEVLTFVDSDDWIEADMYQEMMKIYGEHHPDIISSGLILDKENEEARELDLYETGLYDRKQIEKEIIPYMMYDELQGKRRMNPSLCTKLFKKDFIIQTIHQVDNDLTYGEDAAVTYLGVARANSLYIVSRVWYHYVIRQDSMVRTYTVDTFEKIRRFSSYMEERFIELKVFDQIEKMLRQYVNIFVTDTVEHIYGIKTQVYLFPFDKIEKGSRIIIYGAGIVGQSYIRNLCKCKYAEICGWVDKNYDKIKNTNIVVESPGILLEREYDYIVIAIEKQSVVKSIWESLCGLGIDERKIIWTKPMRLA